MATKSAPKGGSKAFAIIGGLILVMVAVWVGLGLVKVDRRDADALNEKIAGSSLGEKVKASLVPEEERLAYIEANVVVSDLSVDPDTKPLLDGGVKRVAGLLRVTGKVTNNGEQQVRPVRLMINTLGETNDVIGTYLEDLTLGGPLKPQETRSFAFTIPEKKEYGGRFLHKLR